MAEKFFQQYFVPIHFDDAERVEGPQSALSHEKTHRLPDPLDRTSTASSINLREAHGMCSSSQPSGPAWLATPMPLPPTPAVLDPSSSRDDTLDRYLHSQHQLRFRQNVVRYCTHIAALTWVAMLHLRGVVRRKRADTAIGFHSARDFWQLVGDIRITSKVADGRTMRRRVEPIYSKNLWPISLRSSSKAVIAGGAAPSSGVSMRERGSVITAHTSKLRTTS